MLSLDEQTPNALSSQCSARQLVPNKPTQCLLVFVANSAIATIQLLCKTLPKDTISNTSQAALAQAAAQFTFSTHLSNIDKLQYPKNTIRPSLPTYKYATSTTSVKKQSSTKYTRTLELKHTSREPNKAKSN